MYTAVSILVATSRPVSILTFHRDCFLVRPVVESSSGHEVKSRIKILAEDCQPIMITSMGGGAWGIVLIARLDIVIDFIGRWKVLKRSERDSRMDTLFVFGEEYCPISVNSRVLFVAGCAFYELYLLEDDVALNALIWRIVLLGG